MDFIGRKQELGILQGLLKKSIAQLIVIRGRRRIGKSRLAEEFAKGFENHYMFIGLAPQKGVNANMQREEFASQMGTLLNIPAPRSDDWGDLFHTLSRFTQEKRTLIVFDEITWMGSKDPTFLSKLKTAWDTKFKKNPRLILILSGSISSWIEKNILSNTGFVGRISLDLVLKPLPLNDCNAFWGKNRKQTSPYEKFKILSICGGIPRYLEEIVCSHSAEKNIHDLCFQSGGLLYREFENIFSDLFSKRHIIYTEIARHLILHPLTIQQIQKTLKTYKTGVISSYLNDLMTAGFVSRDYTWHLSEGKKSKLSRYRLSDNYTRFYLKYIEPNRSKIESGSMGRLPAWEAIMGLQFENLVLNNRKAIWEILHIDPTDIMFENPFFQTKTNRSQGCQIDYLIQTRFSGLYVCEIKFSSAPVAKSIIREVEEKVNRLSFPKRYSIRPVLIHVNGVANSIIEDDFFAQIIDFSQMLNKS